MRIAACVTNAAMIMATIFSRMLRTRRHGGVASETGNPSTKHDPSQAGMIAICSVAANPIIRACDVIGGCQSRRDANGKRD